MRVSPAMLAAACLALAIPGVGFAFGSAEHAATPVGEFGDLPFTPAKVDADLARQVAAMIGTDGLRFTPAANVAGKRDRSVTVAVRVDAATARALSIRTAMDSTSSTARAASLAVALAPTRYNLGISRGYQGFAQTAKPTVGLQAGLRDLKAPDLAELRPLQDAGQDKPSRFQPRIALEQDGSTGRSYGTLEALGEQRVDVGGSYRLGRNLNVTAGVRLSQDRDRLAPLTDGVEDSQAVYVGTQINF